MLARLRRMSWKRRVALYLVAFFLVSSVIVGSILVAWAIPMGDFDTVHPVPPIEDMLEPIIAIKQEDGHTCGLLAVSAIYKSYGLDPLERRLRQRLGVDAPAYMYDSSSTGCIQPDIYRVMHQDGFTLENVSLEETRSAEVLVQHLDSNKCALALIRRAENGNLHWVVIDGMSGDDIQVHDSLSEAVLTQPAEAYLSERVVSLLLVAPSEEADRVPIWRLHLAGALDAWEAINVRRMVTSP